MRLVVILLLLVNAACLQAREIFRYQDENGVWVYTDRPPQVEQEVSSYDIPDPANNQRVRIIQHKSHERGAKISAVNEYAGPVELILRLSEVSGLQAMRDEEKRVLLPPKSQIVAWEIAASGEPQWSYELSYRYVLGSPKARPKLDYPYGLPVPAQYRFRVSQAFGGDFSHQDAENFHAVDIPMPYGTPILAARSGIVMDVSLDFSERALNAKAATRANNVRILHEDGTMVVYAHMSKGSIGVRPGDMIYKGDKLGEAGATGFATGPHLHFAVQVNQKQALVSVPFVWQATSEDAIQPQVGQKIGAW